MKCPQDIMATGNIPGRAKTCTATLLGEDNPIKKVIVKGSSPIITSLINDTRKLRDGQRKITLLRDFAELTPLNHVK